MVKKIIKKLVASMMILMVSVPVYAKYVETTETIDGRACLVNTETGGLVFKDEMNRVAVYTPSKQPGKRTINAVLKDGAALVEINELADAMDLELSDWKSCYNLSGYNEYGGIETDINIYKGLKQYEYIKKDYTANIPDNGILPKNATIVKEYEDMIEGKFNVGKQQFIEGNFYVPARETINLINQADTKMTYDKQTKTVIFDQTKEWYNRTIKLVPYQ